MKISPLSPAGRKLLSLGVGEAELNAASFHRFNWQVGGAITLAMPGGRCLIMMKSKYLKTDESGQLVVSRLLHLHRHELCHVAQAQRWGFFGYWRRQLWARIATRSLLAKDSDVERPCYEAGAAAYQELAETHPPG
jgi:hypothetical protein